MADQRRAGLIQLSVNGVSQDAKGAFEYNLGIPKREAINGSDGMHGYKEMPQEAFIEGTITDRQTLDVAALAGGKDLTVTLTLANGKMIRLRNAFFAGDGTVNTEEAEIKVKWIGSAPAQEIS